MAISQTTNSAQLRGIETLALDSESKEKKHSVGGGLHTAFQTDCIGKKATTVPAVENKTTSFWSKIASWFNQTTFDSTDTPNSSAQIEKVKQPQPLSMLPILEAPEEMPAELQGATLPPPAKNRSARQSFSHAQILETTSLMSQHTVEKIMCIVMAGQIELEKENALVAENTLDKYQQIKKLQEKVLEEIKDALMKDENVLSYCKTAKNIAMVASVVGFLAATVVSAGLLAPVGIAGALATYGPIATACLAGLTTGATAYSQRRLDEDMAQHEQFNHKDKYTDRLIEDTREKLMSAAEMDQVFKERLIQLVKRLSKMNQLVMQK